jgi:hypothetical protein
MTTKKIDRVRFMIRKAGGANRKAGMKTWRVGRQRSFNNGLSIGMLKRWTRTSGSRRPWHHLEVNGLALLTAEVEILRGFSLLYIDEQFCFYVVLRWH